LNLRRLVRVPLQKNAKGIALFALATLSEYRRTHSVAAKTSAKEFLDELLKMQLEGFSGAAWGYNFDWQSRVLFAPRNTPAVVPTAFVARALIEASEALGDDNYLEAARSVCDFIIRDLPQSVESETELCFGYTPTSNTRVLNASLLAAEVLISVAAKTGERELMDLGLRATRYVVQRQHKNGSWSYGEDAGQEWVDNFHTAFVLSSLIRIIRYGGSDAREFELALSRGYEFWFSTFVIAEKWPKYYDDSPFPADIHAAASAINTLADLNELDNRALLQAERIAAWSVKNMRDQQGFFYYQRRRHSVIRTPFMRWSQAWMLYGLARLLEEKEHHAAKSTINRSYV
jgi:uncharacterized protein YyaL (SSP411 family)